MRDLAEDLSARWSSWCNAAERIQEHQIGWFDVWYNWEDHFMAGLGPREAVCEWWADARSPIC